MLSLDQISKILNRLKEETCSVTFLDLHYLLNPKELFYKIQKETRIDKDNE